MGDSSTIQEGDYLDFGKGPLRVQNISGRYLFMDSPSEGEWAFSITKKLLDHIPYQVNPTSDVPRATGVGTQVLKVNEWYSKTLEAMNLAVEQGYISEGEWLQQYERLNLDCWGVVVAIIQEET